MAKTASSASNPSTASTKDNKRKGDIIMVNSLANHSDLANLPQELKNHPYWCVWLKNKEGSKIPISPITKRGAKTNDLSTFAPFPHAKYVLGTKYNYLGLGVRILEPLCAIDIDHCVAEDGNLSTFAQEIVSTMQSYTEFSPSGKGLRIFFYVSDGFSYDAKKYYINNQKLGLEVYAGGGSPRYVTVTGNVLHPNPIEDKSTEIAVILEKYMQRPLKEKKPSTEKLSPPMSQLADDEVIAKAGKAKNGELFSKLWNGDASGFSSRSEADLKLCSLLAFWCGGDLAQMDRLFRQSALMRDKWDEMRGTATYGQTTLEKAVQGCASFYGQKSQKKERDCKFISPYADKARYTQDDQGNGYWFADNFKSELRFCSERKAWYQYDGAHWNSGGNETAQEQAKLLGGYLLRFANAIQSEDKRKPYLSNALALRMKNKRDTMLRDAQSVFPLYLSQLDKEVTLFNCLNFTLDLNQRKALKHDSAHLISKIAGAKFVSGAKCERWLQFVDEIMMGDRDAARYLQKLFGYCLTGEPVEEKLFILYGATTRNGKSTLLDTIAAVMGDYSRAVLPETLIESRFPDGSKPTPDWARMAGARLVTINEPSQDMQLNVPKVKAITGRDTITARFLHCEPFEFKPQFVPVINTNYLPAISDPTLFTSDRVVVIPFNRHFAEDERDKNLKNELRTQEAMSGVLNWMLDGLVLYKEERLEPPGAIKEEIKQYQYESDRIARFRDECIVSAPGKENFLYMTAVYDAYTHWCKKNGFSAELMNTFSPAFKAKGMNTKRDGKGIRVLDVKLQDSVYFS